jgi:hypothetical protein
MSTYRGQSDERHDGVVIDCQNKSADEPAKDCRSPPLPTLDDGPHRRGQARAPPPLPGSRPRQAHPPREFPLLLR